MRSIAAFLALLLLGGENKASHASQKSQAQSKCFTCDEYKKAFIKPYQECLKKPVSELSQLVTAKIDNQKVMRHIAECMVQTGIKKFEKGNVVTNFVLKPSGNVSGPFLLVVNGVNSTDLELTNCIGKFFAETVSFGSDAVVCNVPFNYKATDFAFNN